MTTEKIKIPTPRPRLNMKKYWNTLGNFGSMDLYGQTAAGG